LCINALGLWPGRFQTAVKLTQGLGVALPVLEIGLVLALAVHPMIGLRKLFRERLKFSVPNHHHGIGARYWS
jgi:hypothetical protein